MYGIEGRSWIALGDPVGPPKVARELAWKYWELVQQHGGQPIFYEVGTTMLHVYLDMGMTLFKLGEEASVLLAEFSLEGKKRSDLRYIHRRLEKEGCSFEVLPASLIPDLLPELNRVPVLCSWNGPPFRYGKQAFFPTLEPNRLSRLQAWRTFL